MSTHPEQALEFALAAAKSAAGILQDYQERRDELDISEKYSNEYVSEADQEAEKAILSIIRQEFPGHAILAEESGQHKGNEWQWVIDPLDGTTNFLHGVPQYSISIALMHHMQPVAAVILDPNRQETFTAVKGKGAYLNDQVIKVSGQAHLAGALLATGTPYRKQERLDLYCEILKTYIRANTSGVRRPGSAALDLAWLAAGRFDGFWEFDLAAWDIAAGILILEEAGGRISDYQNSNDYLHNGDIVASNGLIHDEMLQKAQACLFNESQ